MSRFLFTFIGGFLLGLGQVGLAKESQGKFVPPDGKILLLLGQDIKSINGYLQATNQVPGGFIVYTSGEFADGLDTRTDQGGGVQHAQKLVERYPNTVLQIGFLMVGTESRITSGFMDMSLDHMAWWIKKTKRPVFLRIGYEFDYPKNHYEPEDYILAYRYIVDRLRAKGVNNVAYVWHSYAGYVSRPHLDWYPGDDYVDWFAMSYFRQPEKYMSDFLAIAKKHKKPLMIAEASPWHISTTLGMESWKRWFVPLFYFIKEHNIKALSYVNCNWDALPIFTKHKRGDARVQSNREIKKRWLKEISDDKYLKASPTLFRQLRFPG